MGDGQRIIVEPHDHPFYKLLAFLVEIKAVGDYYFHWDTPSRQFIKVYACHTGTDRPRPIKGINTE